MRQLFRSLLRSIRTEWHAEDRQHMRVIAHKYALRASMDGDVIRKTGEVIPKESV